MPAQLGDLEMAGQKRKQTNLRLLEGLEPTTSLKNGNSWARTGVGTARPGGEIAGRLGANGVAEFSNAPADLADARGLFTAPKGAPQGAVNPLIDNLPSGARSPASGGNAPGQSFGNLGSVANMGNGLGSFSQMQEGDSALAIGRFERANQEREKMVQASRRGAIGEGGGRVTVVRDSSRGPSIADIQNARLDARQSQTALQQQQAQQGLAAGLQQATTEQLRQKQLGQQIRGQELDFQREQSLTGILAGLDAPNLQADDRARLERDYLMRSDPKAYLDSRARSGIGQVDLENKQLQQQVLRQTLQQGQLKSEQDLVDRGKAAEGSASAFEQAIYSSDQLLSHKGLDRAVGIASLVPSMPGSEAADFEARLDTLKAQTFLPQVQSLKGMGALSDAEGKKLLDAVGALSTSMKPETFRAELKRVRDTLAQSQERAMRGVPTAQPSRLIDGIEAAGARAASPVRVSSDSDYAALPSGATFVAPDGSTRRKP